MTWLCRRQSALGSRFWTQNTKLRSTNEPDGKWEYRHRAKETEKEKRKMQQIRYHQRFIMFAVRYSLFVIRSLWHFIGWHKIPNSFFLSIECEMETCLSVKFEFEEFSLESCLIHFIRISVEDNSKSIPKWYHLILPLVICV